MIYNFKKECNCILHIKVIIKDYDFLLTGKNIRNEVIMKARDNFLFSVFNVKS